MPRPGWGNPPGKNRIFKKGARGNNRKEVGRALPLGLLVCVTGVSGSGKSTLINDTLYAAVARHLYGSAVDPAPHDPIARPGNLPKAGRVDHSPIGPTPRPHPPPPTRLFTPLPARFSAVP